MLRLKISTIWYTFCMYHFVVFFSIIIFKYMTICAFIKKRKEERSRIYVTHFEKLTLFFISFSQSHWSNYRLMSRQWSFPDRPYRKARGQRHRGRWRCYEKYFQDQAITDNSSGCRRCGVLYHAETKDVRTFKVLPKVSLLRSFLQRYVTRLDTIYICPSSCFPFSFSSFSSLVLVLFIFILIFILIPLPFHFSINTSRR